MKGKRVIVLLLVIMIMSIIGFTFAYFNDSVDILNVFKTKVFKTEVIEEFESPENWLPGTTTFKSIYVENVGDVSVAVRISFVEKWTSRDGVILSGVQNGNRASIINFTNLDDWIKYGDYYYYNKKLSSGDLTSTFIDSVTFNSLIVNDYNCYKEKKYDILKTSCTSTGGGYDGATYLLTFKVETVQFDSYKEIWNTDFEIE